MDGLLPRGGASPDRTLLLEKLSAYAAAAVREARLLGAVFPTVAERARVLEWLERPVFVCGHHRSGTTLLQNLLDGHPELRVLPGEGTYLTTFAYAARRDVSAEGADRFAAEWIRRFVDPNYEPHFLLGRSAADDSPSVTFARRLFGWQAVLREASPRRARFALLLALVAAYGDVTFPLDEPRMWVEKTPLNETWVETLAEAFPGARFIHLVREPMVTLASVLEAYRSSPANNESCFPHTWRIRRFFRLADVNRERLPSRYLVLRYEDLVGDPNLQMERVRAFLDISPSPALATPTVLGQPVRSNSSFQRGAAGVVVPPRSSPPLSEESAELVRAFVASRARTLGYDLAPLSLLRRLTLLLGEMPRYALDRVIEKVARL